MVSAFAWRMYCIDVHTGAKQAHAHMRMYTHIKIQKDHYPHPNNERQGKKKPQTCTWVIN